MLITFLTPLVDREPYLISRKHEPIKMIFNLVKDEDFIQVLENLSNKIGFGVDCGACLFPEDLDEYDKNNNNFVGVECGLYSGETVVVSYEVFYYYLKKVSENFIKQYPKKRYEVEKNLLTYIKTSAIS